MCPSCGVATTSSGYTGERVREVEHAHVAGRGVFMEELLAELERRCMPFQAEEVGASPVRDHVGPHVAFPPA